MKTREKKIKQPMSFAKKLMLGAVGIALAAVAAYLLYYFFHYVRYNKYREFLSGYEYEEGASFAPAEEAEADVAGMELVAENEFLKLYTDQATTNVAVYDKRNKSVTYSNPLKPDEDPVANNANKNYLKSQLVVYYYNTDVQSGVFDSYTQSVAKGQYTAESIENGIRYVYTIGDEASIHFDVPLEYRLDGDSVVVSVPAKGIREYNSGYLYRIQLLRYFGGADSSEDGCLVVPNGSGSLIYFNNGKTTAATYSQYIYDLDPLVTNYTTTENVEGAKLPIFGICREDRSLLVEVTDGATIASITAGISGVFNDLNYAYPSFTLRNIDNLRMFGDSAQDVYVMEPNLYDINCETRYTFLTEEYTGYAGLANYYREKLIRDGVLAANGASGDIPFYYDVIAGVKETAHLLGTQYLRTFAMTTFEEAGKISDDLQSSGITNQVMNLQGWMNGGYYHDAVDRLKVTRKLGGKSGLAALDDTVTENGGRLFADAAIQEVTYADDGFNYNAEGARYYGAGYVAGFGLVNPTTLRKTTGLGYYENNYDLLSPKFLPRYVEKYAKQAGKLEINGLSLRDLGNVLFSDKKRTNIIDREQALDVVLAQFEVLKDTGKQLMTNAANAYSFAYSSDILNAPVEDNDFAIVDESIPLYEMVLHGTVQYSSQLLNFEDEEDLTGIELRLIEAGASPHYVFTWEDSNKMKNTALNRFYATTYENWKGEAGEVYTVVNDALQHVNGAQMIGHEILETGLRKVTYDNGVVIYINYNAEEKEADGLTIPGSSYRLEGIE